MESTLLFLEYKMLQIKKLTWTADHHEPARHETSNKSKLNFDFFCFSND